MNQETERKNKVISGISTTIICVGLFLIFWFYNFEFEIIPPIEEAGVVAVSLGEPDAGGPEEVPVEAESAPSVPSIPQPENYEQTKDPDAVATKKSSDEISKKTNKEPEKPKEDDLLNSAINAKKNQKASNSGDGDKTGPQGEKDGKDGGSPTGTVGGTGGPGVKSSFRGRTFKNGYTTKKCNEEGIVILDVILMADGRIKYDGVNPASSGSTCLENAAIDYLKSSSFNASSNPVSVEGTITFTFKLK